MVGFDDDINGFLFTAEDCNPNNLVRNMEKSCRSNAMHMNGLPEEVVGEILSFLPIQEAVITSILLKKWRYAWTKVPKLIFDDMFCDESIKNQKSKLLRAISQVLLLHHGPLHEFELALSNFESCPEIDQFILVVLKAGVKKFTLWLPKSESYRLPSSIFAYEQQLELLTLRSCVLKPPPGFNGFSKVTTLHLVEVGITGSTFSSLIFHCPLLECVGFISSTNCGRIDIDNGNLWWFSFGGPCEVICFKNVPDLETVEIYAKEDKKGPETETSSQFMLCGRLPVIGRLHMDRIYAKYMTANREAALLVNDLCDLETLSLSHIRFGVLDDVLNTLCLIKNCKNLEFLNIDIKAEYDAPDMKIKEIEGYSDVTLDHLKEVHLFRVSGLKSELQFIEFILAKSPVLEKFIIEPDDVLVDDKVLRFLKELSKFRRASALVEVSYGVVGDEI